MLARGISGWDLDVDGKVNQALRARSMNTGLVFLLQHFHWLQNLPPDTVPQRLSDEVSQEWILEAHRRAAAGQIPDYQIPHDILSGIMQLME